jgi:acetylornithine deacetylase
MIRAGGNGDEVGVNALEKGIKIIQALQELEQQWGISKKHPLFNPGHFVLHPGVIDGAPHGVRVPFVVSSYCTIDYAVWHHPRETAEQVKKEIEDYVAEVAKLDSWLAKHPPKIEWLLHWPPGEIPSDHPICATTGEAHKEVTGVQPKVQAMPAVTDVAFLDRAGIPSIMYGPGDVMRAHTIDEFVPVDEITTATKAIAITAMNWCGVGPK